MNIKYGKWGLIDPWCTKHLQPARLIRRMGEHVIYLVYTEMYSDKDMRHRSGNRFFHGICPFDAAYNFSHKLYLLFQED